MTQVRREAIVRMTARAVAVSVFVLLIAGALVTSTGSGLAVPDWPLSYGRLMPPMVGGILFEHGHRIIAALVTALVGIEMAVVLWGERRRTVRFLAVVAFGAILLQALLGGLTVLFLLPPAVSSAHAGLAEIVLALTVVVAWMCSRRWTSGEIVAGVSAGDLPLLSRTLYATALATAAVYLQIVLGAVMRHTAAGLAIPDFPLAFGGLLPSAASLVLPGVPIHLAHRLFAVIVLFLVLLAARRLGRAADAIPPLGAFGVVWIGLVSLQLALGALSIWSKKAVAVTVAHLATGALCWVVGVLAAATLSRARRQAIAVSSAPEGRTRIVPDARRVADFVALTKPRITLFVVMTAFVGFAAGLPGELRTLDPALLLHTLLGTALVASGTSAFNQLWERRLDALMERTARRPLPSGRLSVRAAFVFSLALSVLGIAELLVFVNLLTAALAAATLLSYVLIYTPMKTRSPLSTIVGAVPGALPPLGGFTAVHSAIGWPGLALFALLFLWQLPHFFAIGWRHRADYGRAGVRILPTIDPSGRRTGRQALAYCLALVPVTLLPAWLGIAGTVYAFGSLALTLLFLAASFRFARETTDERALTLFLVSIGWLPAVLVLLVVDRIAS